MIRHLTCVKYGSSPEIYRLEAALAELRKMLIKKFLNII